MRQEEILKALSKGPMSTSVLAKKLNVEITQIAPVLHRLEKNQILKSVQIPNPNHSGRGSRRVRQYSLV